MKLGPIVATLVLLGASISSSLASETPVRSPTQSSLAKRLQAAEGKAARTAQESFRWMAQLEMLGKRLDAMTEKIRGARQKLLGQD